MPAGMRLYARLCGLDAGPGARPLRATGSRSPPTSAARTHSTEAIAEFAVAYADQNERDHQALVDAVASGQLTAEQGL